MKLFDRRSMKYTYPKKFFCCIPLQVGGLIVGWLWTIKSLIFLSIAVVYLCTGKPTLSSNVNTNGLLTVVITSSIVNLMVSIILIVAIKTEKPYFILPWLIVNMITITFTTYGYATGQNEKVLFIAFFVMGLYFYMWVCILSLHHRLRYPNFFLEAIEPAQSQRNLETSLRPYTLHKDEV